MLLACKIVFLRYSAPSDHSWPMAGGGGAVMAKIRVKNGAFEVECEASEEFIKNDFKAIVDSFPAGAVSGGGVAVVGNGQQFVGIDPPVGGETTTSMIAQKLGGGTGPELALAAIARIVLVKGQANAPRKEILDEMQAASSYYKDSYSGNLTKALDRLVKSGEVNDVGGNRYTLSQAKRTDVAKSLAN